MDVSLSKQRSSLSTIHHFNTVYLGSAFENKGNGNLRIDSNGLTWKTFSGSEKVVDIAKEDLESFIWTKVNLEKGFQLSVYKKDGSFMSFQGFRLLDFDTFNNLANDWNIPLKSNELSVSGKNWGNFEVKGKSTIFNVEDKPLFTINLPEVTSVQQLKDEVMFEFQTDDTMECGDVLVSMSFHVPLESKDFGEIEVGNTPARTFLDRIIKHTDAQGRADHVVTSFPEVTVSVPRGRFDIQLHTSHLKLLGQTQDYKIKYSSIIRLFILPKLSSSHTLVVISLDPPIRKGQTFYNHVLCQFQSDEMCKNDFDISPETMAMCKAKNEGREFNIAAMSSGFTYEVFARSLLFLSGAKVTKAQNFKNAKNDGFCVRCLYKADEGYLYPLERSFFYVQKPPLLITHNEIDSVEFQRQGHDVVTVSNKTFDIYIRTTLGLEHQFRGIERDEWKNIFQYLKEKQIKIENMKSAEQGPLISGAVGIEDLEELDPGMIAANMSDSDEYDSDYKANSNNEESSDDGTDIQLIDESKLDEEMEKEDQEKEKTNGAQNSSQTKNSENKKLSKDEGKQKAKKRKRKDKNAPKKATTPFLFFSKEMRDKVRAENPEMQNIEVSKILGVKWKEMSEADKEKYKKLSDEDKERYRKELENYKNSFNGATTIPVEEIAPVTVTEETTPVTLIEENENIDINTESDINKMETDVIDTETNINTNDDTCINVDANDDGEQMETQFYYPQ